MGVFRKYSNLKIWLIGGRREEKENITKGKAIGEGRERTIL